MTDMHDANMIDPPPKHRRRWYQYSLRSLLMLMLVVGLASGWLGMRMQQARRQDAIVEAIRKAGGNVYFDATVADGCQLVKSPDAEEFRAWSSNRLGVDIFATANYVELSNQLERETLLAVLDELQQVRHLVLYDTQLSNAELEHLARLHPNLLTLDLRMTEVTTTGLRHLSSLTQLQCLNLSGLQIDDEDLNHLRGLSQLRELYLTGTAVTGAGLEHLQGLTQLRRLYLDHTQVTDFGMKYLKQLVELRHLALHGAFVGDDGLNAIRGLTQLEYLDLWDDFHVTDSGLDALSGMTKLQWLYLRNTRVSAEGFQRLKQRLPKCTIDWQ